MKILLDTDVLMESVADDPANTAKSSFLDIIMKDSVHSLWISAISVRGETARYLVNGHKDTFTIVPLRKSTLTKAANSQAGDFESRILVASAWELKLDAIISKDPSRFYNAVIPIFTPREFLEKHDTGEWETVNAVPFMDLKAHHHLVYNEIDDRFTDIIANTGFILGRHVEEFEEKFARIHGADFALGVSSGTDALHVALAALDVGPGDGVVIPVNTFIATAEAVSLAGGTPVFVDCDRYYNMDVEKLEELLKNRGTDSVKRIRAVIPVHLYGQPADMATITSLAEQYDLAVVEDACQAHLAEYKGRKIGNFGQFSAFSFYPGKNLGAYGEAGALITNDEALFVRARMIRQHGEAERYHHSLIGHNYRMAAIQGAVLNSKIRYLEAWTEKRRVITAFYNEWLEGIGDIQIPEERDDTYCVYHLYVIQSEKRDELRVHLRGKGVATGLHYPVPLHLQKAYKDLGYREGDFPVAEKAAKRILSLPMFPELTRVQVRYVCDNIRAFYSRP